MLNKLFNFNKNKAKLEQVTGKKSKWWLLIGVVYLLLPIDIIPDLVPIAGFADDLIVILFLINMVLGRDVSSFGDRFGLGKDKISDESKINTKNASKLKNDKSEIIDGEIVDD